MTRRTPKPAFSSRVAYQDQRAAVEWLEKAFGFKPALLATTPDGKVVHAEIRLRHGAIHVGSEWGDIKSPASIGGANTQNICIYLEDGLDDHCARARAAGGKIIQEPQDQFHGDRTYRVMDPEGHIWSFSQKLREVSTTELETAVPGMKVWKPGAS